MANLIKLELFRIYFNENNKRKGLDIYFKDEKEAKRFFNENDEIFTYKKVTIDIYKSAQKYIRDHSYGVEH